jgi:two-component system response regulator DevR
MPAPQGYCGDCAVNICRDTVVNKNGKVGTRMGKIRVLIAGSHTPVRRRTRSLLERDPGLEVVAEAGSAGQAAMLARELAPHIAMIDADMPLGDSLDAVGRIARLCPDTSVLVFSAWGTEQFMLSTADVDACDYLLKSVRGRDPGTAIREVCLKTTAAPA